VLSTAYIAAAFTGYLFGSLPTGFLVAKAKGVDIRSVGSGNIGATNVFRILGKGPGILVLLVDALKGFVPVIWLAPGLAAKDAGADPEWVRIGVGVGAILGHNYTCWLRFRGGKGIATSAGVFLGLTPAPLGIAFTTWVIFFALSRYVSLASIAAAAALPAAAWMLPHGTALRVITTVIGALAIFKHRANIRRLLAGTENRIGGGKEATSS
jgi:glycerol-3-phosphate acyltransferase PlsY